MSKHRKTKIMSGITIGATVIGVASYFGYKYILKDKFFNKKTEKNKQNTKQDQPKRTISSDNAKLNAEVQTQIYKPSNVNRVGHWNILNFGGSGSEKGNIKVNAIAEAIHKTKQDIVGLTEVNYRDGDKVQRITKTLNELGEENFDQVIQPQSDSNTKSSNATKEVVAILYNTQKYKLIKSGSFNIENNGYSYKRTPFGAMFEDLSNGKKVITFFAHLDSPGVRKDRNDKHPQEQDSQYAGQGTQEVFEAENIENAFKYFQKWDPSASIIFGGDTNIMTKNRAIFENNNTYKNYYNDIKAASGKKPNEQYEYYETSLGSKQGYANAYDKILFKENDNLNIIDENEKRAFSDEKYQNSWFKLDLVNSFNNGFYDKTYYQKLWTQYEKSLWPKDFQVIRSKISDHTLVWIDYVIN
ncbi:MnuA family membrane nuclease [Mycoplasma sp. HS2188]|uniref:MnuA family membrane nuclease n=1 Tax=Mycoplasma sp. HS2188 TaxID=2976765 RepID=UPI0021A9FB2D|nr:hypothetical protein [Mycoplasma sp. HS2188]MCT4469598.1 hypothetical protein [Mycoplasma sp. HS2188]